MLSKSFIWMVIVCWLYTFYTSSQLFSFYFWRNLSQNIFISLWSYFVSYFPIRLDFKKWLLKKKHYTKSYTCNFKRKICQNECCNKSEMTTLEVNRCAPAQLRNRTQEKKNWNVIHEIFCIKKKRKKQKLFWRDVAINSRNLNIRFTQSEKENRVIKWWKAL